MTVAVACLSALCQAPSTSICSNTVAINPVFHDLHRIIPVKLLRHPQRLHHIPTFVVGTSLQLIPKRISVHKADVDFRTKLEFLLLRTSLNRSEMRLVYAYNVPRHSMRLVLTPILLQLEYLAYWIQVHLFFLLQWIFRKRNKQTIDYLHVPAHKS